MIFMFLLFAGESFDVLKQRVSYQTGIPTQDLYSMLWGVSSQYQVLEILGAWHNMLAYRRQSSPSRAQLQSFIAQISEMPSLKRNPVFEMTCYLTRPQPNTTDEFLSLMGILKSRFMKEDKREMINGFFRGTSLHKLLPLSSIQRLCNALSELSKEDIIKTTTIIGAMTFGKESQKVDQLVNIFCDFSQEDRVQAFEQIWTLSIVKRSDFNDLINLARLFQDVSLEKSVQIISYVQKDLFDKLFTLDEIFKTIRALSRFDEDHMKNIVSHICIILNGMPEQEFDIEKSIQIVFDILRENLLLIRQHVLGRKGTMFDLCKIINKVRALPKLDRDYMMQVISTIIEQKEGTMQEVEQIIEKIPQFLEDAEASGNLFICLGDIRALHEVLDLMISSEDHDQGVSHDDRIHVHTIAGIYQKLIWDWMRNDLREKRINILEFTESNRLILNWIDRIAQSGSEGSRFLLSEHCGSLKHFLLRPQFFLSLRTQWGSLDDSSSAEEQKEANRAPTGADSLKMAVTFCSANPQYQEAFIIQGLLDAYTAFLEEKTEETTSTAAAAASTDEEEKNNISCANGIAERFLIWARDAFNCSFLEDIVRTIYNAPEYNRLINIDEEKCLDEYKDVKGFDEFKDKTQKQLLALKEKYKEQFKAQYSVQIVEYVFAMEKLQNTFNIFDDSRDSIMQNKLRRAFESIRNHSSSVRTVPVKVLARGSSSN